MFGLVDVMLENIAYGLLPFKIFCHCFYCRRGSKIAGKCDVCTRFFIDDNDLGAKIDGESLFTKKGIYQLPICSLFYQVKTRSFMLNLFYLVGDHASNDIVKTENFGEIFFEIAKNPFGVYIVYLQTYFRVFFNLLKLVIMDNYLLNTRVKKLFQK